MMDDLYTSNNLPTVSEISVYHLVNALTDAAFICDHSGQIIACSNEVLPFFGLTDKSKVIGSNILAFIAYEHIDELHYNLLNTVNESSSRTNTKLSVKKGLNETFYSNITFTTISNDSKQGNYALITFREAPQPDPHIEILHKKDARLSRLNELLIDNSNESTDKLKKLVSQIGETLGATTCLYNRIENGELFPSTSWESPFNKGINPQLCSKQLLDYLNEQNETFTLIRKPVVSSFLASEPTYNEESGVKAIMGFTISKNNEIQGLVSVVFTFHYSISTLDQVFINTIIQAIENQSKGLKAVDNTSDISFREMIDCIADPVFILSAEGIFKEVNKSAVKQFGYQREEMIGQTFELITTDENSNIGFVQPLLQKALAGELQKFEWYGKQKNGNSFPNEIMLNKGMHYGREVVFAICRDMSASKNELEELLRQNVELKESNISKDKFFGIFAHDLKNPFQGLLGFIDLLYEDLDELTNDQVKEYLANVRSASYHTYTLLENLLEWSRIQSGKMPFTPSIFEIRDEINSVISVLENNAVQKEIQLVNEMEPGIFVEADRNMMHSVIQNIITNSIKFSNAKGRVVIRGRVPQDYLKTKKEGQSYEKQWLEVSISDNGIGIPDEILPRLFKLNGQYSQPGTANEPGTGLGLVLCHEMVEKNGGRIWAESIAGQGTTFIFTIQLI
jgi:PAS domain S-box-containing protein